MILVIVSSENRLIVTEQRLFDKASKSKMGLFMKTTELTIAGKNISGVEISLPKAPLVLAKGDQGFVMCGYLSIEVADKLGVAAAVVRGVATVDDLLKAPVQAVSKVAAEKGVTIGMTGHDALACIA